MKWIAKTYGNAESPRGSTQIVDAETGREIVAMCGRDDAQLLAAAPELRHMVRELAQRLECLEPRSCGDSRLGEVECGYCIKRREAAALVAKTEPRAQNPHLASDWRCPTCKVDGQGASVDGARVECRNGHGSL